MSETEKTPSRALGLSRRLVIVLVVVLLAATVLLSHGKAEQKTVTAHFPRAVSVYVGSDVRILGVNVGRVTAVVPEGNSVRVEMTYDATYDVPADAQAAVITPTLVADRFVQLTPVYTKGAVMADDADIPLPRTAVPVELDRIYAALRDLTETLGPNGVNADGSLDHLLAAAATALDGQGAKGNEMIRQLSRASGTFAKGSGPLFDTVSQLATFTDTLAQNDALVRAFLKDLAGVSSSLVSERGELQAALAAVAQAVHTVETFVKGNRKALVGDVERLNRIVATVNSEKNSVNDALRVAPVAIGNLALAYNAKTGSVGSRINLTGNVADPDGLLCAVVQQSQLPSASKDLACKIFKQLLEPVTNNIGDVPPALGRRRAGGAATGTGTGGSATGRATGASDRSTASSVAPTPEELEMRYQTATDPSLSALIGGGR